MPATSQRQTCMLRRMKFWRIFIPYLQFELHPTDPWVLIVICINAGLEAWTSQLLEVCDDDFRHFLREVERGSQFAADKPHLAGDILSEHGFASLVRKKAVHLDLGGAGNSGHLSLFLTAFLEAIHVRV